MIAASQPSRIKKLSSDHAPLMLDIVERLAITVFFGYLTWNLLQSFLDTGSPVNLILLLSEGAVIAFVIFRRFTNLVSRRPQDWLVALCGTTLPLLVMPEAGRAIAPQAVIIVLMLSGIAIQIAAKLTLRRSFGVVAANRGIKISGPYRVVRHPMYAGYVLTQIGFLLAYPTLWNLSLYALALAFQLARIQAEERILMSDENYKSFAQRTKHKLIPGIY